MTPETSMTPVAIGPLHPRHGIHAPTSGTPDRTPGSVRRTATTDMLRPEGLSGPLILVGRARDLITELGPSTRTAAEAATRVVVDYIGGRTVEELTTTPDRPALQAVLGRSAAGGFRGAVLAADPAVPEEEGLLNLLLDDIPVATLVSGHAWSAGDEQARTPHVSMRSTLIADQCAGFASDATIMTEIARSGRAPVVTGPAAPSLANGDPLAWHELDPLPPHAMRRSRRMDIRPGTPTTVDVLFRDSYVRPDGLETVVHEYTVLMTLDADTGVVTSCEAAPRVLPWAECPAAAASARRLAGQPVAGLRAHVRQSFLGTSTCTHLNDTLRSLEDVPALLSLLAN
ncbi:MAG TPA: DUF2889 domain-containing protein [Kineosporiaceae bacterium]